MILGLIDKEIGIRKVEPDHEINFLKGHYVECCHVGVSYYVVSVKENHVRDM